MISTDIKYVRLNDLGEGGGGGGAPTCFRYRSLTKGCALVLFFLCFSSLFYVSRNYLFSPSHSQRLEETLPVSGNSRPKVLGDGEDAGTINRDDRKTVTEETTAEKTRSWKQTPKQGELYDSKPEAEHKTPAAVLNTPDVETANYAARETFHDEQKPAAAVDDDDDDDAASGNLEDQRVSDGVKKFFFFNPRPGIRDRAEFDDCGAYSSSCGMASSAHEADVILFNAARMSHVDALPVRRPNQIWVMYSREPPDLHSMDYLDRPDLNNQVNYSRLIYSDSTWQVLYGVLKETTPPKKNYEKLFRQKRYDVAWFVSHCNRPSRRMEYVRRMMSMVDVHIFGKCGNRTCGGRGYQMGGDKEECLQMLSRNYKFYLSFENTMCRDYVSEKFFNMFEGVDVIPVVRGGGDYQRLFPPGIFIDAKNFPSPESLGKYLHQLGQDEKTYVSMLRKKSRYKKGRHKNRFYCELCERAHTGQPRHVYKDFYQWVRAPGNCWKPTDLDES